MRASFLAVCLVVPLVSGCVSTSMETLDKKMAEVGLAEPPKAFDTSFQGKVPLTALEAQGHSRPQEDYLWPVSQAGFLLNLSETPKGYEVRLTQSALAPNAQWLIMLHSHKAHGTNTYVEHITNWTTQAQSCLRVPSADLAAGTWQVMIHTREAVNAQYTLKVTTWGVQGTIEADRHGHKREDGAFQVDKHAIDPCTGEA